MRGCRLQRPWSPAAIMRRRLACSLRSLWACTGVNARAKAPMSRPRYSPRESGPLAPNEVVNGPPLCANDIVVPLEGAGGELTRTVSSPMQVHGVAKEPARRAPGLGEHNHEILIELGFDPGQIEELNAARTVARG